MSFKKIMVRALFTTICAVISQVPSANSEPAPTETPIQSKSISNSDSTPLSRESIFTIEQIREILSTITTPAGKFEFLRSHRKTTLDAITNVSNQLAAIESKLSSLPQQNNEASELNNITVDRVRNDLTRAKDRVLETQKRLDNLIASKLSPSEKIDQATADLKSAQELADNYQNWLPRAEAEEKRKLERLKNIDTLRSEREIAAMRLLSHQRLLGSIDDLVNQLFIASDATNDFKLKMSIAFSALVGVVIIGFFGIAWSNDEIKRTIFANEAGIQFITIFSIVIAVILFGIIGVLESKELSALLGGLSGYILGKTRPQSSSP